MSRRIGVPVAMTESSHEKTPDLDAEREEIGEFQDRLDEEADGEGLGAEAGRGEETGLSQG